MIQVDEKNKKRFTGHHCDVGEINILQGLVLGKLRQKEDTVRDKRGSRLEKREACAPAGESVAV